MTYVFRFVYFQAEGIVNPLDVKLVSDGDTNCILLKLGHLEIWMLLLQNYKNKYAY